MQDSLPWIVLLLGSLGFFSVSFYMLTTHEPIGTSSEELAYMEDATPVEFRYSHHENYSLFAGIPLSVYANRRGELYAEALNHKVSKVNTFSEFPEVLTERNSSLGFIRACYFGIPGILPLREFDTELCTHIIIAFAYVHDGEIYPGDEKHVEVIRELVALKKKDPKLKILMSLASGGFGYNGLQAASATKQNRTKFGKTAVEFMQKYDLDGMDVDWEFPGWYKPFEERFSFSLLIEQMRVSFGDKYLLTVAVAAQKTIVDHCYEVPQLAKNVDFINLMTYDLHMYKWYFPVTGHNAPLFSRQVEKGYFATLNTAWSAEYWVYLGMPREKVVIGLPMYGRTYRLVSAHLHNVDAPVSGTGRIGHGFARYSKICQFVNSGATRVFDEESMVPYAYLGKEWVSYDDVESFTAKAKWLKTRNFGGAMILDLNMDDFEGVCSSTKFPLLKTLQKYLQ